MLFKPLLFAATAAAFLITGDLPEADEGAFKILPIEAEADALRIPPSAFSQSLEVPCRRCKGKNTHLEMDFAIEEGSRLTLNGFELYPNADPFHGDLSAEMMRSNGKASEKKLGYSLAVVPVTFDEAQQMEIINVQLHIIEVGNRFIEGIPTVGVNLLKNRAGELLIGNVVVDKEQASQCASLWCRFKKLFSGFRGCSKSRHGVARPSQEQDSKHDRPHGIHHHHGEGHHRNWFRILKGVAIHIFLPGLMGLLAGIGIAVVATILCTSIIHLARFIRTGRRQNYWYSDERQAAIRATEVAIEEEKIGLVEQVDSPIIEDEKN